MKILLDTNVVLDIALERQPFAHAATRISYEDAVQSAAAVEAKIDVIVTRNKADYSNSPLTVLTPDEFVSLHLA